MNLRFPELDVYKSPPQVARVLTEAWGRANLYCASCPSNVLQPTRPNARAVDFECDFCGENYQLKSGKTLPKTRIVDAAYKAMIAAIRSDRAPNLLYLHYELTSGVRSLLLVPRFFFTEECIEARKELASSARRAGWVGCNIRLDRIAPEGRIGLVENGCIAPRATVRERFRKIAPLSEIPPTLRGWTLAVLLQLHSIGRQDFTLEQAYQAEAALAAQFPRNRNIRPKIRQQLQVLRDLGILEFLGRGCYRFS
jgi:type II restriction enzyme